MATELDVPPATLERALFDRGIESDVVMAGRACPHREPAEAVRKRVATT
jgi:hypothetical protein